MLSSDVMAMRILKNGGLEPVMLSHGSECILLDAGACGERLVHVQSGEETYLIPARVLTAWL